MLDIFRGHTDRVFSLSRFCQMVDVWLRALPLALFDLHLGHPSPVSIPIAGLLESHTDIVWSVALSPDGTRVVSGSEDRIIRVWITRTGEIIAGPLNSLQAPSKISHTRSLLHSHPTAHVEPQP